MNFLESYGYMDPMLILMQIPHLLHLEEKLFESCGCLLLVCRDDVGSSEFTIYEMMKGCYVWLVREEDSLLVINLSRKVKQYNLVSKTLHDIFDYGSNQLDDNHDDDDDELLQQLEVEHNIYEFISFVIAAFLESLTFVYHQKLFFAWVDLDPVLPLEYFFAWVDLDPGLPLEAFFSQVESELQVSAELDFKLEKGYDHSFHQRIFPKENLKMDLVDYVDEEEEPFEDEDEEEEEEHLALVDSILSVPDSVPQLRRQNLLRLMSLCKARKTVRPYSPMAASTKALIAEYASAPTPPSPFPLSLLPSPLPLIPSLPLLLPLPTCMDIIPEADMMLQNKVRFTNPSYRESSAAATARQTRTALTREVNERMTDLAATHRHDIEEFYTRHQDAQDDRALLQARISTLRKESRYFRSMSLSYEALHAEVRELERTRDAERQDGPVDAGSSCTDSLRRGLALADYEANRGSGNGDDSHNSGSGRRRPMPTTRECTYSDFLKYQPLNFKGTEGVNSHVKTVGHNAAYGIPWKTLMKMMTDKYCPKSEIKKLEIEIWNLNVKGTYVVSYTQRFQELALMCRRMFPKEYDQMKKYIGGLTDMIKGSVMASKPKMMQEAIEFANYLIDQKIRT
ncbi:reverse transcriptase domain-containing protein, partial [Tanacetum coccineum]